jgi:hypothetical protein
MNHDRKEVIKEQIKGWTDTAIGTVTGNEDRRCRDHEWCESQGLRRSEGEHRGSVEDPGEPTNQ